MDRYQDYRQRFWSRVKKTEKCWLWQGSMNQNGYGTFSMHGQTMAASRAAYLLVCGPIATGLHVCHTCDNRACVRPGHLFLGTHIDNLQDAIRKGRKGGKGRLSTAQWVSIEQRIDAGETRRALAREFHVTHTAVINHMLKRRFGAKARRRALELQIQQLDLQHD